MIAPASSPTVSVGRGGERLRERLDLLGEIAALAQGRLPPDVAVRTAATAKRADERLEHGATHTVVALAGATGSGKSSMFNALAGSDLATVGVRRPTTASTQAAVFTADGTLGADTAGLLDWLGVRRYAVVIEPALAGLVLLDLPDHDSTSAGHRQEVDRMVHVVDVFIWVVDPQKYADAALHEGYLRRFAGHADVTLVALNHVDTLPADARREALEDLGRLLTADGLNIATPGLLGKITGKGKGVRLFGVSARTGEGIDDLRRELGARVGERRALVARLDADVDWIADDLESAIGTVKPGPVPVAATRRLGAALASAGGVDGVVDAVAEAHRIRGRQAAGWPPTRWLTRLRRDPLRRLGLDRRRASNATEAAAVPRTSLPPPSPIAAAGVSTAIRRLVDDTAEGLPSVWRRRIVQAADSRRGDLDDAIDRAVGAARLPTEQPRWWRALGAVQRVLAAVLVVGLLWLVVLGVVAWLRLPGLPTPKLGEVPWPTVLAVGGAVLGLLLATAARWATAVGARSRAARARRTLVDATTEVGERLIVQPVDEELRTLVKLQTLSRRLHS
jgi:energy-coupling factor transporter ATP-binding protein EcfA2